MGHENAEGMAHVGVPVEPPVRLGRVGTALHFQFELESKLTSCQITFRFDACAPTCQY